MSYCRREASGKDKSVFVTKQDVDKTEFVKELVEEDTHGIILPSGEINWDCPCLGNLPQGSCGGEFKAAFSCFHYSEEEDKGMDCIPNFRAMQECFEKYPEEYGKYAEDEKEESKGGDTSGESPSTSATPSSSDGEPPSSATPSSDGERPSSATSVGGEKSSSSSSSPSGIAAKSSAPSQEQQTSHTSIKSGNEPQAESHSESKLVAIQVPTTS